MSDETLYLYTSLTAGSSHIITATSRIETILKANKIPFKAIDIATHEKGRLIWARRSKGRNIPGLVKYNDVVADLDQIEEWNEHGELEDQLEELIDIFGDVPVSATSAEAQAAARARAEATKAVQGNPTSSTQARTASETRHISISDPKGDRKVSNSANTPSQDKDSPMSLAMKQAGQEAAEKAGQKKADSLAAIRAASTKTEDSTSKEVPAPTNPTAAAAGDADEPTTMNTEAKTPAALVQEGKVKTVEKAMEETESDTSKSNEQQVLSHERKASVPNTRSSLAQSTSIDEAHTMDEVEDDDNEDVAIQADKEDAEGAAKKVGATDTEETKVLGEKKPQEQSAIDVDKAGDSVGD